MTQDNSEGDTRPLNDRTAHKTTPINNPARERKQAIIVIKTGREKPLVNRHPWVFSGAIEGVRGNPAAGELVTVVNSKGAFIGRGYWNERSQIQVRLLTWNDEAVDETWWAGRIERAYASRAPLRASGDTDSYRLVHAESDYLPGLIVDVYGDWAVLQALTFGIDARKTMLTDILRQTLQPQGIYERSDVDARGKEGLRESMGVLWGAAPPPDHTIHENGLQIRVDIPGGHKTGYYLDQRANRQIAGELIARFPNTRAQMLNLFSYTGGFGLHALQMGKALGQTVFVTHIDASHDALELAEVNTRANGFAEANADYIQADVFALLRDFASDKAEYEIVVCDPPKFAHNISQVEKAARGYKDLNLNAFKLVAPGGYLLTFSCSGAISIDLFQKIVFGALADSGRDGQIIARLGAGEDHPVALTFPEGEYLKGLLVRVF